MVTLCQIILSKIFLKNIIINEFQYFQIISKGIEDRYLLVSHYFEVNNMAIHNEDVVNLAINLIKLKVYSGLEILASAGINTQIEFINQTPISQCIKSLETA